MTDTARSLLQRVYRDHCNNDNPTYLSPNIAIDVHDFLEDTKSIDTDAAWLKGILDTIPSSALTPATCRRIARICKRLNKGEAIS